MLTVEQANALERNEGPFLGRKHVKAKALRKAKKKTQGKAVSRSTMRRRR